ncbi:MAG TPA: hypothetical protein PKK15_12760 [Kouleothrix sp.]|uniref:hypothetical protein n=1 Tax=Kouleothrix sp. TaxID=2779161 RepID=UPI002CB79200|nr:hypothetical protein [Kouleothrix sp.]
MARLYFAALLLFALLAALPAAAAPSQPAALAPQGAAPGAANPDFMGMVVRDPFYDFASNPDFPGQPNRAFQDTMGRLLANAGVRWVRIEFMRGAAPEADFARYDYFIGTVAPRYGLKVLGLLATNIIADNPADLNRVAPDASPDPKYGYGTNPYMRHWLDAALRIAAHYNGADPQAGRVHAFEVFNEMNRLFGDGTGLPAGLDYAGLNPAYVARIHAKFYRICKNTDASQPAALCPSDTQIILGGLHPKGTSARRDNPRTKETFTYTDEQYLQAMYQSAFSDFKNSPQNLPPWNGAYPVDGVGFHPYPEEITPRAQASGMYQDVYIKILPRIKQIRDTLVLLGDGGRPLWITEIGYNLAFYKNSGPGAPSAQADFMREIYTSLAARGDIANVFWFKYEDFPPADGANAQMWGVVRIRFTSGACEGGVCYTPDGTPDQVRPAYLVYRELAGLPIARTYLPVAR